MSSEAIDCMTASHRSVLYSVIYIYVDLWSVVNRVR